MSFHLSFPVSARRVTWRRRCRFTSVPCLCSQGDLEKAVSFYQSTLALQSSFEPAKERLRAIQCSLQAWREAQREQQELEQEL